ncbi:MAG: oligosaccharide flippase family protein [Rikenellaceae bacterium]
MLEKLAKQSAIYGVSTILGRLLSYLLTPYYTRLFAPAEYGIITDLYALIPFTLVILTMGMESSYFRFGAKSEEEGRTLEEVASGKRRLFATTWGVTILCSVLFTLVATLFREPISAAMGAVYISQPELVMWVALIIMFDVSTAIPFARLRERGDAKLYVLLKLLNIVLQVGLAVAFGAAALFASDIGVGWVVIANLIASVVTFVVTVAVSHPYTLPHIEWRVLSRILIYSLPLLLSGVAATATEFIDRQLIKHLTPADAMSQLGLYGAVTKIAVVMTLFTQMYRLAAEPFFLSNFKKEEFVESNAAAMKYYIIATVAIFLGITLFKDLFALIVGRDFREGVYILPIILCSNLLMGVWLNLSFWYKREERTEFALYITVLGLATTIVANLYFIPRWGYCGAAWARFVSESAMVCVSYLLTRRYFPIPYDLPRIAEYFAVGGLIYFASTKISEWDGGVAMSICSGVVLLSLYATFAVVRERIDVVAMCRSIFKRR